jgi:L-seryl-tRNA(Ser) seleniumtransferase
MTMSQSPYRQLPAVHELAGDAVFAAILAANARDRVVAAIRLEVERLRECIAQGKDVAEELPAERIARRVGERLKREEEPGWRSVINATGIVLHTNLGRAPLAEAAARAAYEAARGYIDLEIDLRTGARSSRQVMIRAGVCRLTGAESATVVNNNAAATVIALRALCREREVIVSRGQLIEIGGSFRIPEIMAVSGAVLREVGTTNITRLSDYEQAITPQTAALLRVHASNYRISGFTEAVPIDALVALGARHHLPVIDDIGSGALIDFNRFGFSGEPVASASIAAGAALVLFSGDKLLGGPQAGIIAGKKEHIERIEKDPLMRAFRCDKMTLAALETTLRIYANEDKALRDLPVLRLLSLPLEELHQRAAALTERLRSIDTLEKVEIVQDVAYVGGGSLPDQAMATWVIEVKPRDASEADFARRLRLGRPAILGRVRDGKLLLDVRTILPHQEDALVDAIQLAGRASASADQ